MLRYRRYNTSVKYTILCSIILSRYNIYSNFQDNFIFALNK